MLRNLNQADARGRILGIPQVGVKGAIISALTGTDGPGIASNDNLDPAKEYRIILQTWPASGELFVFEDTSFTYTPDADGTYSATYKLEEDGVLLAGTGTVTLQSGATSVTIDTTPGSASANGVTASIQQGGNFVINCGPGAVSADGIQATVTQYGNAVINCLVGGASAAGQSASISQGGNITINCAPGAASADGVPALVTLLQTITAVPGAAVADGVQASIMQDVSITALVGNAIAAGVTATIVTVRPEVPETTPNQTFIFMPSRPETAGW